MDLSIILGSIGVAVSGLFGIWGIYLALRKIKYPASLSFVHEQVIGLFDDVTSKLPNLAISYKDKQIESNVILINGYIANDGNKDISPHMIERDLTAVLPRKWKWLECKILSKPEELEITSNIKKNELSFGFGLFRRGESFSFQALIIVDIIENKKKIKSLVDKIEWSHRISDLGKINSIDLPYKKRSKIKILIPISAAIFYFSTAIFFVFSDSFKQPIINHMVPIDGEYKEAKIIPKLDGTAKIKIVDSDYEEIIDFKEYVKTTKIFPVMSQQKYANYIRAIMSILMFLSSLLMLYMGLETEIKKWRVKKLIRMSNKEKVNLE